LEGSVCPRCRYDFGQPVEVPGQPPYQEFSIRQGAPLAGWWMRFLGYSIDYIVVAAVAVVFFMIGGYAAWIGAGIVVLYFWVANSLGRSIGKLALGLRIVTTKDGTAPGLVRGLVRTIGYYVSSLFFGFGFVSATWDKNRQAWHDKMAGTIVIKTRGS
jgi:uncharacterized RDD family membrane protein YckC